jgi:hypothetical protein
MKRSTRHALVALFLLGAFAVVNAAFEKRVLEPMLGPETAAVLATIALGGALLASGLLWAAMRRN